MLNIPRNIHITENDFRIRGFIVPTGAMIGNISYDYYRITTPRSGKSRKIKTRMNVQFICMDYDPCSFSEDRCFYNIFILNNQTGEFYPGNTKAKCYWYISDIIEKYTEKYNISGKCIRDNSAMDYWVDCPHERNVKSNYNQLPGRDAEWAARHITDTDAVIPSCHQNSGITKKMHPEPPKRVFTNASCESMMPANHVAVRGPGYPNAK